MNDLVQPPLFRDSIPYRIVRDCDPTALEIANQHYSRRLYGNVKSRQFVGPGENMILLGVDGDWLFIWRKCRFRLDFQTGVECTLFRNNNRDRLSSSLIAIAEAAWDRTHGPTRKFTYVDPKAIKPKRDPGRCFLRADWKRLDRISSRGLLLFAKEAA